MTTNNQHYDVARRLLANERYLLWLSPEEARIFVRACSDQTAWKNFMNGTLTLIPPKKDVLIYPIEGKDAGVPPVPFSKVANARIRQMIFEQLIPDLFPQNLDQCSALAPRAASIQPLPGFPPLPPVNTNLLKSTEEFEIYDESDDEETSTESPYSNLTVLNLDVPIDDMYYSFDYDAELMVSEPDEADGDASERSASPHPEQGAEQENTEDAADVHASLKYLFMIVKGSDPVRVESIKQLLDEVRPSRSKWASDNIGQEELYISLDKSLQDLKGYAAHSYPFLKPVQKREAPDYYDVIKNPMDLGTMTTKLERHQYTSKKEFADDLALIWNNCMQYNLHPPDNIYRRHANAMRRKTSDLLKKIPEITIVKVAGDEQESDDEDGHENGTKEVNGTSAIGDSETVNGHVHEEPTEHSQASAEGPQFGGDDHEQTPVDEDVIPLETAVPLPAEDTVPVPSEEILDKGSTQERKYKEIAKAVVRERCTRRTENLKRPFGESPALIPTSQSLGASVDDEMEYIRRNKKRRLDYYEPTAAMARKRKAEEIIDEDDYRHVFEESYFPEVKYPEGCVPGLHQPKFGFPGKELDRSLLFEDPTGVLSDLPSLSDYPELFPKHKGALEKQVDQNIKELQRVKDLHAKIVAREADVPEEPERKPTAPYQPPKTQDPLPLLAMNKEAATAICQQSVSKILLHAGFDVASESALATLTDTFTDYFLNLGKTMRAFSDKFSKTMSAEDILTHTLQENGVETPSQLDQHVRLDIDRYGDKLTHLRRKLSYAYKDMVKDDEDAGDIDVEEAADDIVSGNFFGDLDMLNLRELGIDGVTSIPRDLWNKKSGKPRPIRARVRRRATHREEEPAAPEETQGKPSTLPWRPVRLKNVIGLLRPYYKEKMKAGDMVEDEQKAPNTLKSKAHLAAAKMGRKRAAASSAHDDAAKKKKKGPDPAVKAQREADKARKAQEKADRQKLREEQTKNKKAKGKKAAAG
ncbi:hypothetical protein DFJ77DRAFT_474363 [Powellomyces hirtus]|nr:hypothetical protein DFJ77DRAFT_474363 [Powellomyces hirtus]